MMASSEPPSNAGETTSEDVPQTASETVIESNGNDAPTVTVEGISKDDEAPAAAVDEPSNGISADEIALYDRQIRLWGVQAQERIRSAKVLLITVKAVGTEIAKNLILGGIGSLTIADSGFVSEEDLGAQYFLRDEDIGKNRAQAAVPRLQELNPRVAVVAEDRHPQGFHESYYQGFDLIVASDLPFLLTTMINAGCRLAQRPFYATGTHGFYGFIFADLIQHDYMIERAKSNMATSLKPESVTRSIIGVSTKKENGQVIELVTKRETYSPLLLANSSPLPAEYLKSRRRLRAVTPLLPALRALWEFERNTSRFPTHSHDDLVAFTHLANEKVAELQLPADTLKSDFLRPFLQNIGAEIAPAAAFVGGRLAEDVINVLGKREQPIQNFVLFDGDACTAPIYALHPIFGGLEDTVGTNGGDTAAGAVGPGNEAPGRVDNAVSTAPADEAEAAVVIE